MQDLSEGTFQGRKQWSRKREEMFTKRLSVKLAGAERTQWERTTGGETSRPRSQHSHTWPLFSEPWGLLTWRPELNFRKSTVSGVN